MSQTNWCGYSVSIEIKVPSSMGFIPVLGSLLVVLLLAPFWGVWEAGKPLPRGSQAGEGSLVSLMWPHGVSLAALVEGPWRPLWQQDMFPASFPDASGEPGYNNTHGSTSLASREDIWEHHHIYTSQAPFSLPSCVFTFLFPWFLFVQGSGKSRTFRE